MKPIERLKVLVVEDDEPKLRSIISFLSSALAPEIDVISAASLSSAVKFLSTVPVVLAIVDMSIPTFDFATDRAGGGQPQGYGGADILRFIETETTDTLSVVLTQYEEFPTTADGLGKTLSSLSADLSTEFGSRFLGVVHYAGQQGEWRDALLSLLKTNGLAVAQ